ncbi:MAG: DNA helicase RecQ [Treponemataceae bacterium]|nr:DNA helicase RecQ [Treponemataceae bacterium]
MSEQFSAPTEKALLNLLKKYFGYTSFRPGQLEIINSILAGNDTLAIMPTGGGKSLCCQIPALVFEGITLVVSPLIALMQDQVNQLEQLGIAAVFMNSSLTLEQYQLNRQLIRQKQIKLLYCAPETLLTERMENLLADINISLITIDEAHCISEWGHDFRPEYRMIETVRKKHSEAVCLALTATATQTVRDDIRKTLRLGAKERQFGFNQFVNTFNRPNICLQVVSKAGSANGSIKPPPGTKLSRADELVLEFLKEHQDESGIIYCFSRKQVDELTELLRQYALNVLPYHAGLSDQQRTENQDRFVKDEVPLIVATLAFGMGINKPNVRFVIHYDMPKSLEQYYQEIGRAGRDGEKATALLLFSYGDTNKIRFFMQEKTGNELKAAELQLNSMLEYAQSRSCRRTVLLNHFGESFTPPEKGSELAECCCDICQNGGSLMEENDVTIPAQKFLSAVARTGERFGAGYVADVLIGSKNQRILDYGHQSLSVYGIGKEYSRSDWLELARLLVDAGFLHKSSDYQVLSLTKDARDTLRERGKVSLAFMPSKVQKTMAPKTYGFSKTAQTRSKSFALASDDATGGLILEALKQMRKKLAAEANLPPYMILSDKALVDIAVQKPRLESQLTNIYGIGESKAERYGSIILRVVREYIE